MDMDMDMEHGTGNMEQGHGTWNMDMGPELLGLCP
jgi:hypothetical protein